MRSRSCRRRNGSSISHEHSLKLLQDGSVVTDLARSCSPLRIT